MTAFLRSTRGHRLRIEEQHERPFGDEAAELHRRAVLVEKFEVIDDVAFVHVRTLPVAGVDRTKRTHPVRPVNQDLEKTAVS